MRCGHPLDPELDPQAGLPPPPHRGQVVHGPHPVGVDPHRSGLQPLRHPVGQVEVVTPDGGTQPEGRVVGRRHRRVEVLVAQDREGRGELLLA